MLKSRMMDKSAGTGRERYGANVSCYRDLWLCDYSKIDQDSEIREM